LNSLFEMSIIFEDFYLMKPRYYFFPIITLILFSCQRIQEPQFKSLENFGIKKVGFTEVVIGFETVYSNPNNFGVSVKEAAVDVYIDSLFLGRFTQPTITEVARKSDFSIPLEGSIPVKNALKLNGEALLKRPVQVRAIGTVKIGKGGLYVTKDLTYQGMHRLDSALLKNPAGAGFIF